MFDQILDDVDRALEAKAYYAALNLALTIPDICGKAMYDDGCSSKRYIRWYNEYIEYYSELRGLPKDYPTFNGLAIYKLRCAMLHQGSLSLNDGRAYRNNGNPPGNIDKFEMEINDEGLYLTMACEEYGPDGNQIRLYRTSVNTICMLLTRAARACYRENKEKFGFMEGEFIYVDGVTEDV